jgi:CDGSH-type Zn-finger protein
MWPARSDLPALTDAELELLHALDGSPRSLDELAAILDRDPDAVRLVAERLLSLELLQRSNTAQHRLAVSSKGVDVAIASVAGLTADGGQGALITPYRDGPLVVRGPFRLVDQDGREIEVTRGTIALCRCGKSRTKPFCDGTHKLTRFAAPSGPQREPRLRLASPPTD